MPGKIFRESFSVELTSGLLCVTREFLCVLEYGIRKRNCSLHTFSITRSSVFVKQPIAASPEKSLPEGGTAMLFVGTMDAANARERTQGIKEAIAGTKIEIIDIRTDGGDQAKAKANVEDTLTKYPDINLLVGLWAYNTPQIYNAVKAAGMGGKVKIVGFDEDQQTLKGISEGVIDGTVVQQPYEFGYQSMITLAKIIEGDTSVIPANKQNIIPTQIVDKSNVEDFAKRIKDLLAK